MNIMQRIRIYHAILASLSLFAYFTGELGYIHSWLGYGVAIVIAIRLLWVLSGERQVGLMRFYPSFQGLNFNNALTHPFISKSLMLGIAVSLILATGTGIAIDKGKSLGLAINAEIVTNVYADDDERENDSYDEGENIFTEIHELFANLMLLFVGMHITYLVLFKLPLVKFMLFVLKPSDKK